MGTCRLVAAHEDFFVTNDEKYQTCLIFGLHVTNDENAVNVARTRGNFVDPKFKRSKIQICSAIIQPHFDYCSPVWDEFSAKLCKKMQKLQKRAARVVYII